MTALAKNLRLVTAGVRAEARESARQHAQKIRAASEERQRNAVVAQHAAEWNAYKQRVTELVQQQQRKAFWDNRMALCDELISSVNPPEPEPDTP